MRTRIGTLVIFAALAAALSSARPLVAAGTIQSVSAVPSPAAPNQDVTLTLRGVGGPCRATLFFGDGTYVPLVVSGFPTASKHRYPAAGMFFVRALGRAEFVAGESTGTAPPPCVGGGDLPLSVLATGPAPSGGGTSGGGTGGGGTPGGGTTGGGSSGGGTSGGGSTGGGGTPGGGTPGGGSPGGSGGASSGASAFAAAPAKGRSVVPTHTPTPSAVSFGGNTLASPNSNMGAVSPDFTSHAFQTLQNPTIKKVTDDSQPTPGGVIGVEGAGFGTWIVNRRMILKTGGKQVDLQIVNWGDNAAAGTVPDDFGGVPDGAATIQLVNGIKRPTNEMPLSFTAARETVEIIKRPVGIRGCYNGGMAFTCNGVDSDNSGGVQDLDSAPSVYVYHGCTHWDLFHTGDDGHDTFEVQLKNGWIFEDAKVERICGFGDMNYSGCYLIDNLAATVVGRGKPIGSISTSWHVPRLYAGIYDVHIYATGPAGVPYQ